MPSSGARRVPEQRSKVDLFWYCVKQSVGRTHKHRWTDWSSHCRCLKRRIHSINRIIRFSSYRLHCLSQTPAPHEGETNRVKTNFKVKSATSHLVIGLMVSRDCSTWHDELPGYYVQLFDWLYGGEMRNWRGMVDIHTGLSHLTFSSHIAVGMYFFRTITNTGYIE